jgi:hypothetical protein
LLIHLKNIYLHVFFILSNTLVAMGVAANKIKLPAQTDEARKERY